MSTALDRTIADARAIRDSVPPLQTSKESPMSNKTVTITLPDDEYAQLKELAEEQDRYISGQARHMLRAALAIKRSTAGSLQAPEYRADTSSAPAVPSATYVAGNHPTLSGEELLGKVKEHQPAAHQNPTEATSKTLPG